MSEFDKRQKGFEKKHVMDEEKKFKIESRRNKYIGEWVSDILNYNEDQKKNYIQEVIKADFKEAGDQDVFRKVKEDLKNHVDVQCSVCPKAYHSGCMTQG